MNHRIVIEDGVLHITATLAFDEIERFREALRLIREAIAALEEYPKPAAVMTHLKPGNV